MCRQVSRQGPKRRAVIRKRIIFMPHSTKAAGLLNCPGRLCSHMPHMIRRVGQNHIHTPYMTVNLVISLPKILHTVI